MSNDRSSPKAPGTRVIQGLLASLGIALAAFGLLMPVPRLVQWIQNYYSTDQQVSEESVQWLWHLKPRLVIAGAVLALAAIPVGYLAPGFSRIWSGLSRWLDPVRRTEQVVAFLGRWTSRAYAFVARDQVLLAILLIMAVTLPLLGFLYSSAGGFHVEGIDLQPAKNLARHGIYGTLTTRGFDDLTYRSSAGPGIILPSALAFWIFGVNILYARLVAFLFVLAAVLVFYRVGVKLYDRRIALLGTFLILPSFMQFSFGGSGSASEGYVPGFLWVMIGALCWFQAIETGRTLPLWLAGLAWGWAFQTKWLFLFSLIALVATWLLLRWSAKPLSARYWLVPSAGVLAVTGAWTAFRIWNVGLREEITHFRDFWAEHWHRAIGTGTDTGTIAGLLVNNRTIATLTQVDFWGDLQLFLVIPAVIYIIYRLVRDRLADYRTLYFLVFGGIWFFWWFFLNFDLVWVHLRVPRFVGTLFVAVLLAELWRFTEPYRTDFISLIHHRLSPNRLWAYLGRVTVVVLVLGGILLPLWTHANTVYVRYYSVTKPYREMLAYLRANTEKNAVFSGWTWSLPFYVDFDPAGDHVIKDRSTYPQEQREAVPEYFIVAAEWPLVKRSDQYPNISVDNSYNETNNDLRKKFIAENCELVKSFGSLDHHWQVYKVRPGVPQAPAGQSG